MDKTILIAANDPNIIYLLRRYAETMGFNVERCNFGEDMIRLAVEIHPDLILFEIESPESSWRPFLQRLKSDRSTQEIPVVLYSYLDEEICFPDGEIAGFLNKSIMYNDFIAALDKAGVHPLE